MADINFGHPHTAAAASEMIIDESVEIVGNITVKGRRPLIVRGVVDGHIQSDGPVEVVEGGFVRGTLSAGSLTVSGRVEGTAAISVHGLLDMRTGGELIGKRIAYLDLQHARGARLTGDLEALDVASDYQVSVELASDEPVQVAKPAVAIRAPLSSPGASTAAAQEPSHAASATLVRFAAPTASLASNFDEGPRPAAVASVTHLQALTGGFEPVSAFEPVRGVATYGAAECAGLASLQRPEAAAGVDQVPFRENLPPLVSELPRARDTSLSSAG